MLLEATDSDRRWLVMPDWTVRADGGDPADGARVQARTGDLALLVWQRADPLADPARFVVSGGPTAIAAVRDAPIHL